MRRIERRKRKPAFMNSPEFRAAADEFARFSYRGGTRAKQGRSPLRRLMQPFDEAILSYLRTQFDGLCAYTEVQSVAPDDPLELVWHRPPSNATSELGSVDNEHYWWFALDWRNWYLASNHLASVKGNSFPVHGDRMGVPAPTEPLRMPTRRGRLDTGLLLDPCEDSPALWLRFANNGGVRARNSVAGTDRGALTIAMLDLDNSALRTSRAAAIREALAVVEAADTHQLIRFLDDIATTPSPHRSAVAQTLIRRRLGLQDRIPTAAIRRLSASHPDDFLIEFAASKHDHGDYSRQAQKLVRELANEVAERTVDRFGPELTNLSSATDTASAIATAPAPRARAGIPAIWPTNRINRIEIKNFRAIVHVVLDLDAEHVNLIDVLDLDPQEREEIGSLPGRPWKMLLGENGSGKSSVLHALALALCGAGITAALERADLTWDDLLRWKGPDDDERLDGQVRIDFTGGKHIDLRFDDTKHWFHGLGEGTPEIHLNVRGYGAARFPASKQPEPSPTDFAADSPTSCNIDNLLDSTVPILNTTEWLGELGDPEFNVAAETISDLLGESSLVPLNPVAHSSGQGTSGQRITRPYGNVMVDGEPLSLVSDGYRSVIALGCEIMAGVGGLSSATGGTSDMRQAEGIVLLDEIGAHLHPRWRMQITGKLRKAFPNVQFFVTTHEPLCLRGLVENEVVRVTKYEKHGVLLDEIDRAPGRYRVDQLLTSEFFGLNSAIDPRVDRLFTEYYELKRQARLSSAELERVEALEEQINDRALRPVLGYTRRDQLIFEAIDDFLIGDTLHAALPQERKQRRAEIVTKVAGIWKRFSDGQPA